LSVAAGVALAAGMMAALAPRVQADPPVTGGLTIWLDATDLNGDGNLANNPAAETAVGQWDNKASGYSALDAIQTTAGYKPKMFRDATTGRDVVRFQRPGGQDTAVYLQFNNSSINTLLNSTNTAFAVARANMGSDNGPGSSAFVFARPGYHSGVYFSGYPFGTSVNAVRTLGASGTTAISASLSQYHDTLTVISRIVWGSTSGSGPSTIQMWKRDGSGSAASAQSQNANTALWHHNSGNILRLGCANAPPSGYVQGLTGDIGEILIYNRALSESERAQVEDYLAGRWITDYSALLPVTINAGAGRVRDVMDSATNYTHVFVTTGPYSFVVNKRIDVEYLLVAGGGGGGSAKYSGSGGGGGGGVLTNGPGNKLSLAAGTYTITVGKGGAGGTTWNGANGDDSSITNAGGSVSVIAKGGGGGGGDYANNGSSGSSGGGGAGLNKTGGTNNAPGQGKNGGAGYNKAADDTYSAGGGGGGYGGVGQDATDSKGGDGGVGVTNSLAGYALSFAGGGGGGRRKGGTGFGKDGGGNGVKGAPTAGAANSGGGGGGNGNADGSVANGAAGGSGIVIIKYALPGPPKGTMLLLR
jgi:hypothetical protein